MNTNPIHSSPAAHEAPVKAAPRLSRQKPGPSQAPLPQDKVTISSQTRAISKQTGSARK